MKRPLTTLIVLLVLPLVVSGCGITLKRSARTTDGGVFRSTDGGETWTQTVFVAQEKKRTITVSDVSVTFLQFDSKSPRNMYLGTRERGIYLTQDRGDHWQPSGLSVGAISTLSLDPSNSNIAYTSNGGSILKSIDGLQGWATVFVERSGVTVNTVLVDPNENNRVLAGTSAGGILLSEDFGNTWRIIADLKDGVRQLFASPARPKRLYAITLTKGVHVSTDGGATWKTVNPDPAAFPGSTPPNALSITPTRPDELALATNYGLLISRDGGATWKAVETVIPFRSVPLQTAVVSPADPETIFFTVGNRLYQSNDGGQTWRTIQSLSISRPISVVTFDPDEPSMVFVGTIRVKK